MTMSISTLPKLILVNIFENFDQNDLYTIISLDKRIFNVSISLLYKRPVFKNIKSFEKCSLTLSSSQNRINYASLITHLDLSGLSEQEKLEIVDSKIIPFITSPLSRLQSINVFGCRLLTNGFARAIASSNLNSLRCLEMGRCVYISAIFISEIVKSCKNLEYLGMQGMRLEPFVIYGGDDEKFGRIEALNIGWTENLANDIVKNLKNLRELNLSKCLGMNETILEKLTKYIHPRRTCTSNDLTILIADSFV
ncbi:15623_t:CDS:2 [Acaulospora morrowiae]|uniref:15623_t:CDS:1 n=1 Tax=Acaulospora morrowiae TaxID=94023 RepID=A0A9N8Z371_9GLOM|nr:15623_t:CDS:2 [Acaulospora morrowiae]